MPAGKSGIRCWTSCAKKRLHSVGSSGCSSRRCILWRLALALRRVLRPFVLENLHGGALGLADHGCVKCPGQFSDLHALNLHQLGECPDDGVQLFDLLLGVPLRRPLLDTRLRNLKVTYKTAKGEQIAN